VRNALVAAGLAAAALIGLIVAVIVSSGSGGGIASSLSRAASPATGAPTGSTARTVTQPQGTRPATGSGTHTTQTRPGSRPTHHPAITYDSDTTVSLPTTTAAIPPPPPPHSSRVRTFSVGVVDDSLAQPTLAATSMAVAASQRAGFDTVVVSVGWSRGVKRPSPSALHRLGNISSAARKHHMRLFLVIGNGYAPNTPRTAAERAEFASFAAATVEAVPHVAAVTVGNEPNLNTFWMPQFTPNGRDAAAPAYEDLLARTYDAVKKVAPDMTVIGGAVSPRGADRPNGIRPTHSPTVFIRDLGKAYRASGRRRPIMDAFGIHPYMIAPWVSPKERHPYTGEITFADYPKLVTLLDEAFRGTHQRGRTLPIYYSEFGVQTLIPDSKLSAYSEGSTIESTWGVSAATQAAYYRQALALAYCQPTVKGLFVFHTFDEPSMNGWQSGLYYADHTPKPSLQAFRRTVDDLRDGKLVTCGR